MCWPIGTLWRVLLPDLAKTRARLSGALEAIVSKLIPKHVDGQIREMARPIYKEGVASGLSGAEQIGSCEVLPNTNIDVMRMLSTIWRVGEEFGREIRQLLPYRGEDFLTPILHCLMSRKLN
ncbi:hypothetical protein WI80_23510 [Burkholderia ubonensis]|nr:hypothetical protein WI80_23510 [Burkholderia ubonensis]KVU17412.1 hypothetical protein WK63_10605 [Burkholderia ubonensis]